ncbi:F0F1 ATP synthase subunit B [Actinopolymorpha alba]|uniref:F0F1 ATP synthase subunit B n=1 Tax=Actinopolymorpha alba TaxID=533267 RepID=UPI000377F911|nr:F0F1 ATP synthase subunit B [Actinopolymorpha alba]
MTLIAAEEQLNPLVPHPSEMILGGVVFLIILFMVWKFVTPRFEKAYADRTAAIEGGLKEAAEAQDKAKAALDEYTQKLAEARHEAARIREKATEQGAAIIAELRAEAQAEARRIVDQAQTQIEAERQQVLAQLRTEIGDLSIQLADRIVGEVLDDEVRQRRIVERFLAELEEQEPVGEVR